MSSTSTTLTRGLVCVPLAPLLVQVLRWSFLALRGDFNVSLAMHEEPAKMQIRTEMLQVGGSAQPGSRAYSGPSQQELGSSLVC